MQRAKTKKKTLIAWSQDEVKLLKGLFPQGRAREIAKRTGRSLEAVKHKAYYMGIRTRECRPWSADEVQLLKELRPNETAQAIADKLGRAVGAVNSKASEIGLGRKKYHLWSKQEVTLLNLGNCTQTTIHGI